MDIRGEGLFIGVEFRKGEVRAKDFVMALLDEKVLCKHT